MDAPVRAHMHSFNKTIKSIVEFHVTPFAIADTIDNDNDKEKRAHKVTSSVVRQMLQSDCCRATIAALSSGGGSIDDITSTSTTSTTTPRTTIWVCCARAQPIELDGSMQILRQVQRNYIFN